VQVSIHLALASESREHLALSTGDIPPAQKRFELEWRKISAKLRAQLLEIAGDLEALAEIDLRRLPAHGVLQPHTIAAYPDRKGDWESLLRDYLTRRGPCRDPRLRALEKPSGSPGTARVPCGRCSKRVTAAKP
jgi:hypothetical protein